MVDAGSTFGHYQIESLVGRGGMGSVYLATASSESIAVRNAAETSAVDCFSPNNSSGFWSW